MSDMLDMPDKFRLKFLQIFNEEKDVILPIWATKCALYTIFRENGEDKDHAKDNDDATYLKSN